MSVGLGKFAALFAMALLLVAGGRCLCQARVMPSQHCCACCRTAHSTQPPISQRNPHCPHCGERVVIAGADAGIHILLLLPAGLRPEPVATDIALATPLDLPYGLERPPSCLVPTLLRLGCMLNT